MMGENLTFTNLEQVVSRDQSRDILQEAAEVKHNLMPTYLYAAFSIKVEEVVGPTAAQAKTLQSWRHGIYREVTISQLIDDDTPCSAAGREHFRLH